MLTNSNSGRKIGQVCAKYLKEITLELGGAAPLVVLADADLEFAAYVWASSSASRFADVYVCLSNSAAFGGSFYLLRST